MKLIPLRYNLRNLRVRWATTLLTVLVTAMVVCSSCVLFGLVEGLRHSQLISGEPLDVLVLRKGASNENESGIDLAKAQDLATLTGVARGPARSAYQANTGLPDVSGTALTAGELINLPVVERTDGTRANIIVRGVDPTSPYLRPDFAIVRGRYFDPGKDEAIVAAAISKRFKGAGLGETLQVGKNESYKIVGLFEAGGSASESEVWVDRRKLAANINRGQGVSSGQVRAVDPAAREAIIESLETEARFGLKGIREVDFYAEQQVTAIFLTFLGAFIAILLSIGAMFAAANTMFAAVKGRTREIGTMRALGFSRHAVLLSFLGESLIICTIGGVLGWLATLPFRAWRFGINDFQTFSERAVTLRFGPLVFAVAFGMTLAMGLFGGLLPAFRAVNLNVVKSLREV